MSLRVAFLSAVICALCLGLYQATPSHELKKASRPSPADGSSFSSAEDQRSDRTPEMTEEGLRLPFHLDKGGFVTAAVVDEEGTIVRTLIRDTYFSVGENAVTWDLRTEGHATGRSEEDRWRSYDIERAAAAPGRYRLALLAHEGITPRYEFSVQSPGNPPWHTSDNTGAWLGDHGVPYDVAALGEQLLLTTNAAEAGHKMALLDENRQKVKGWSRVRAGFSGPHNVARGDRAWAWFALHRDGNLRLSRMKESGSHEDFQIDGSADPRGLAALNGTVYVTDGSALVAVDEESGEEKGRAEGSYKGLAASESALYAVKGDALVKMDGLGNETTITDGLSDPEGLAYHDERLYVSTRGTDHVVEVFTTEGRHLQTIGKKGGPQEGTYDEERMSHPRGLAVGHDGKLWVAEAAYMPKRVSVWDAETGAFERAFYGPPKYGGGLFLDPEDRTRGYYSGHKTGVIEFALDWEKGKAKPSRILRNREKEGTGSGVPHFRKGRDMPSRMTVTEEGERYFFSAQAASPGYVEGVTTFAIWKLDGDTLRLVAMAGGQDEWDRVLRNRDDYPEVYEIVQYAWGNNPGKGTRSFAWADTNGNGAVDAEEVKLLDVSATSGFIFRTKYIDSALNLYFSDGHMLPSEGLSNDAPVWGNLQVNFGPAKLRGPLVSDGEITVTTLGPIQGWKDGKEVWRLHSQWPLRANSSRPARFRGELITTTRLLSSPLKVDEGETGKLFGLSSDTGEIYLITSDGFFLTTLLGDNRTHPLWRYPEAERGMAIGRVSPSDEHFWPFLCKSEGQIYLTAGKEHSSILRLDGLAQVRREREEPFEVTAEMLSDVDPEVIPRETRTKEAELPAALAISESEGIRAEISYQGGWHVVFETPYEDLLQSSGDLYHLFAEGGGLDLLIGGKRLFVTRRDGRLVAVLYEEGDGYHYTSPVGEARLKATDVTDRIALEQEGGTYRLFVEEGVLPEGEDLKADVGIVVGDGQETKRRVYWARGEAITADLPSEARLEPDTWGTWKPRSRSR